jgi:hypothetical protein
MIKRRMGLEGLYFVGLAPLMIPAWGLARGFPLVARMARFIMDSEGPSRWLRAAFAAMVDLSTARVEMLRRGYSPV